MSGDAGTDTERETETEGEGEGENEETTGLTYAEAGVDVVASEAATGALVAAAGAGTDGAYAGLFDAGDRYLALATDGVGTKLLVAAALGDYSTVGIDCVAMNVNDLVAAGVRPLSFVDYLAVDDPDEDRAAAVGTGLAAGAKKAGVALVGGETAVLPEIITGLDVAGTAAGLARKDAVFPGEAAVGDALVGYPSSGVHSNGLTLAREAVTRDHDYTDEAPFDPDRSIGEVLLEPTRLYTGHLDALRDHDTHAAAHVTGGGWTNLERMGDLRYDIEDPHPAQDVFSFVQAKGDVSDAEMHRTFNMGTGFVAAVPADRADALATATGGRVVGRVREGTGVAIRGLNL